MTRLLKKMTTVEEEDEKNKIEIEKYKLEKNKKNLKKYKIEKVYKQKK
jgi:hypothetical protein